MIFFKSQLLLFIQYIGLTFYPATKSGVQSSRVRPMVLHGYTTCPPSLRYREEFSKLFTKENRNTVLLPQRIYRSKMSNRSTPVIYILHRNVLLKT